MSGMRFNFLKAKQKTAAGIVLSNPMQDQFRYILVHRDFKSLQNLAFSFHNVHFPLDKKDEFHS